MKLFFTLLLLLFLRLFFFCPILHAMEAEEANSYLSAGIGLEQLTYKEQVPDLDLTSSDTELTNWVIYLEGRKALQSFFIGIKANIPLSTDEAREYWTRAGKLEQTNSLTYRWIRAEVHVGYFFHNLLNPYLGIGWSYAEQERSNFENVNSPGIVAETATEEVNSFSALLGIQGGFPLASRWSFSYFAVYMLPVYSKVTNNSLPGWEASNIDSYSSYALTGRLNYTFSASVSAALQVSGGKQHWEGSDWIQINDSRVKWPENNTDFICAFISIYKYF